MLYTLFSIDCCGFTTTDCVIRFGNDRVEWSFYFVAIHYGVFGYFFLQSTLSTCPNVLHNVNTNKISLTSSPRWIGEHMARHLWRSKKFDNFSHTCQKCTFCNTNPPKCTLTLQVLLLQLVENTVETNADFSCLFLFIFYFNLIFPSFYSFEGRVRIPFFLARLAFIQKERTQWSLTQHKSFCTTLHLPIDPCMPHVATSVICHFFVFTKHCRDGCGSKYGPSKAQSEVSCILCSWQLRCCVCV